MTTYTGGVRGTGSDYEALFPAVPPAAVEPYIETQSDLSIIGDEFGGLALVGVLGAIAVPPSPTSHVGVMGTSSQRYFFYDVLHINPVAFGLGSIASDTVLQTVIWNGFFSESSIDFVTAYDSAGIISRFPDFPGGPVIYIAPFSELLWEFLVQKDVGPASFNSVQSVVTNDSTPLPNRQLYVSIIGSRLQPWAFAHNWQSSCMETLEWLTSVQTAHDGTEHRTALRDVARRSLETELYLTRESARKLDHTTFKRQNGFFAAPLVPFATRLTEDAPASSSFLYCDTDGRGFVVGSSALLLDELESSGVTVSILTIGPNYLELTNNLPTAWPRGSSVYPSGAARVVGDIPLVWQTKDFATGRLRMEFQPTFNPAYTPHDNSFPESYNPQVGNIPELEVLNHEPDWAGGLSKTFSFEAGVTDSQTGAIALYSVSERPARTTVHNWLLRSFQEVQKFREFLYRRRGRANPFWAPSWVSDLRSVPRLYNAGDTELVFYDSGFMAFSLQSNYFEEWHPERNHLQIQLKNGSFFRARITAVEAVDSETTKIIFDRTYLDTFNSSDIVRISWLNLYRLADDAVTFEWLTPGVARVSLPMVTVPDFMHDDGYGGGEGPI